MRHPDRGVSVRERLQMLLVGVDAAGREPIAQALEQLLQELPARCWTTLLSDCASILAGDAASALRAAATAMPDTTQLRSRLPALVSPSVLLDLPGLDRAEIIAVLLSHPDLATREQTLDALGRPAEVGDALTGACAAWSRRMLIAGLGELDTIPHTDRLKLQEQLLAEALETVAEPPRPDSLAVALRQADDDAAALILAERAETAPATMQTAMRRRDGRMLLTLCRQADCTAPETLAVLVQLGRLRPDDALRRVQGWGSAPSPAEGSPLETF